MKITLTLILMFFNFYALQLQAWGGRGHDSICQAATFLVKDKDLKEFLTKRPHIAGHLCNIPDTHWRSLGPQSKSGDYTHFIEPDVFGQELKITPTDLSLIIKEHTGKTINKSKNTPIVSIPKEMGTIWWRAEQLFNRAVENGKIAKSSEIPKGRIEEQNESNPFNKGTYEMLVNMGIMGHFCGDVSQPLHNTVNYDGWETGHGGIHGFYEDAIVGKLPATLVADIVALAEKQNHSAFTKPKTVVEKMKTMSEISYAELPQLFKMDSVKTPSQSKKEKGMDLRTPAERELTDAVVKKFKPMILNEMARSAKLLATLWDEIYLESGKPSLKDYKSFKYPHTPDFIAPDYYEETIEKSAEKAIEKK